MVAAPLDYFTSSGHYVSSHSRRQQVVYSRKKPSSACLPVHSLTTALCSVQILLTSKENRDLARKQPRVEPSSERLCRARDVRRPPARPPPSPSPSLGRVTMKVNPHFHLRLLTRFDQNVQ